MLGQLIFFTHLFQRNEPLLYRILRDTSKEMHECERRDLLMEAKIHNNLGQLNFKHVSLINHVNVNSLLRSRAMRRLGGLEYVPGEDGCPLTDEQCDSIIHLIAC